MGRREPARSYRSSIGNLLSPGPRCYPVRIVLVGTGVQPIPPPGYGGVERTLAEFADALRVAGHDPVVVNEVRRGRSTDEYRFAARLPRQVAAAGGEIVHASTPVVANRLALAGIPYVYTTHSRHWFDRSGWRQRWGFWLERRAVRRSAATVALTSRLARTIAGYIPAATERLTVIPIGVDAERFRPDWPARTGTVALGVGVIARFKRWELAARALAGTGWKLELIGPVADPAYAESLRGLGTDVNVRGEVDEPTLRAAYARADLLVHPSRVELLAGVVLQGLAAGLPVLGAEPVADLIPPGAGGAAPEGSAPVAVERFLRERALALRDPTARRRAGEAARAGALARYAWSSVVRDHVALYERLGARP